MNVAEMAKAFASIRDTMTAQKDNLISLDQQNGDGDLGITMSEGYSAVAGYLATTPETDLGRALMKCSGLFNEAAPSTLGTITSMILMGMAKSLKGKTDADLAQIVDALDAGLFFVMEKAGSKPGEKTILDALVPAVQAMRSNTGAGKVQALEAAAAAAADGSEATKKMKSVHGRAAYYAEKSIGVLDGGSVAGRLVFESLARWAKE